VEDVAFAAGMEQLDRAQQVAAEEERAEPPLRLACDGSRSGSEVRVEHGSVDAGPTRGGGYVRMHKE
jgi:hypothetical protein